MSNRDQKSRSPAVFELLEEAVTLLRRTPGTALLWYYAGAIPFWLTFLYFVADMSRSGLAREHLATSSLWVALSFLWMKCCHCLYTTELRAGLQLEPAEPWTWGRTTQMALAQIAIQPWGMYLRAIGLTILLPFVWISSFCLNVTVLGGAQDGEASVSWRAWKQARLWPWTAHALVLILYKFMLFVWINVGLLLGMGPTLLKTLFGIETMASRSAEATFLNTTFVVVSYAFTCMCVDPIWKAVYVLRCFYGESRTTGADLRLQLRAIQARSRPLLGLFLAGLLAGLAWPGAAHAEEAPPTAPTPAHVTVVDPVKLDSSIRNVLERREYTWRQPRPAAKEGEEESVVGSWLESIVKTISDMYSRMVHGIDKFIDWLRSLFHDRPANEEEGTVGAPAMRPWVYGLIVVSVIGLAWAAWRAWKTKAPEAVLATAVAAMPDLQSSDVVATDLPEDGWLRFAQELMQKGDLRLALRAAYLACLAHLGQRQLITIARYKSDREYDKELHRRAKSRDDLLSAFGENLLAFERVWYGEHEVTAEAYQRFSGNLERIRAC